MFQTLTEDTILPRRDYQKVVPELYLCILKILINLIGLYLDPISDTCLQHR